MAQFEARSTTPVLPGPFWLAVADFNHDGKADVAVASCLGVTDQVSVLLGNGDGTFQTAVNYTVGDCPSSVAVGDFNGDGNMDLAVTNDVATASYVAILLGNGDGTFRPSVNYPTPQFPEQVYIGDCNNDHKLDLIVLVPGGAGQGISVLLGNGDGTFQAPIVTVPPAQSSAIAIGDFNRDGKLDVAATEQFGSESAVQILLGNGDGTFSFSGKYPVTDPAAITAAGLTRDGNLDLVVANNATGTLSVLLGNGDGTFRPAVNYPTDFPIWVAVADFNGDGKPDIVVANFLTLSDINKSTLSVFLGNGDGTFQAGVVYPVGREPRFVAVGDFNGDHRLDLAVAGYRFDNVSVLLNTGVVSFSPTAPISFKPQLKGTTSAPQTITFTNAGTQALAISSMKVEGQFGISSDCGSSVAPGTSCAIYATFAPRSIGSKAGAISIIDSASTKPQVIELVGAGTVVRFSPTSLTFSAQTVGTLSPPQAVQLTNEGETPLTISKVSLGGDAPGDFSETNACVGEVAAGASCMIEVRFRPRKRGVRHASLAVTDNGGASPQTVALAGTGN